MKKTMMLLTITLFVVAFGLALEENCSAESKEMGAGIAPYNGVTFFNWGSIPACGDTEGITTGNAGATARMFNGVTLFDLGQSASGRVACAGQSAVKVPSNNRPYNGITLF
ncbi:MAG TPA: hypothetical protein VF903_08690 [Nitrospirota bacterium]